MDPQAIVKATERLEHARAAVVSMKNAKTLGESRKAWIEFLIAANAIYSKLEQGAKVSGASQAWYGRKKHERRKDELLCYIHHARHSEEHTIQESANWQNLEAEVIEGDGYTIKHKEKGKAVLQAHGKGGVKPVMRVYLPGLRMRAAKDARYNDVFNPPTKHLGKKFTSVRPVVAAETALPYLASLIAEAAKLTK